VIVLLICKHVLLLGLLRLWICIASACLWWHHCHGNCICSTSGKHDAIYQLHFRGISLLPVSDARLQLIGPEMMSDLNWLVHRGC